MNIRSLKGDEEPVRYRMIHYQILHFISIYLSLSLSLSLPLSPSIYLSIYLSINLCFPISLYLIYLSLSLSLHQSLSILANTHVLIKSLPVSLLASLSLSLPHTLTFTFSYFIITIYCSCNLGIWSRQYSHHLDNPTIREFKTEECLSTTSRENEIVANHFRLNHHNDSPG